MEEILHNSASQTLRTECGKEFDYVFRAIKLVRDEKHNFHVVYKTFQNEYIYSFCNPFQDSAVNTYNVISEEEAKRIFLARLSEDNAHELFSMANMTL
ncbi:hypothetical protein [Pontibacter harenae]|uniref:hypothetical protein n=1 Tax=Pontibacter harenae TaxID=2894083 RepID=UPI001E52E9AC|nr:hypothetical protein [Pontibacter harenae]MCC9166706.1 hypothetical protein [Pontibacter harenae]